MTFRERPPNPAGSAGAMWRALRRSRASVCNCVNAWMVWRTIDALQRLDDRTLKDIGMPRGEIEFRVRELMPRNW